MHTVQSHRSQVVCLVLGLLIVTAGCLGAGTPAGDVTPAPDEDRTPDPTDDEPRQGSTPPAGEPTPDDAAVRQLTSGVSVCQPPTAPTTMWVSRNVSATGLVLTVEGNVAVGTTDRRVIPAVLTEPEPDHYVLYVETEAVPDGPQTPCDGDGYVPYEAVLEFPHDSPATFELTVVHDGDPVARWGEGP